MELALILQYFKLSKLYQGSSVLEFLELFWNIFGTGNVLEKKPLFQACSGIVLEFKIFDERLLRLQHFRLPPVWISHLWENIISVLPNYLFLKNVKMFLKCSGIVLEFFKKFCWPPCIHPSAPPLISQVECCLLIEIVRNIVLGDVLQSNQHSSKYFVHDCSSYMNQYFFFIKKSDFGSLLGFFRYT